MIIPSLTDAKQATFVRPLSELGVILKVYVSWMVIRNLSKNSAEILHGWPPQHAARADALLGHQYRSLVPPGGPLEDLSQKCGLTRTYQDKLFNSAAKKHRVKVGE